MAQPPSFRKKTCVYIHSQPEKNVAETLKIETPLGISKSVAVSVDTVPELLESQQIDPNISQKDSLTFELNTADAHFKYSLAIDDTEIDCVVTDAQIACPLSDLTLEQGQAYPYTLRRYLDGSYIEIYNNVAQTAEPVTITPDTVQPDETVVTHINEVVLTANKPLSGITDATLTHGESTTPVTATVEGATVRITSATNLPRSATFTLNVANASSEDGGFLQEPFVLTFHTSGGPRVASVNISKTKVPVYSNVTVTMNVGLQLGQTPRTLASITIGGEPIPTTVSYNNRSVIISPASNLPKCTDFTVHVAGGSVSVHGIGDGSAWSYSARTICHDTFYIGSSVNGRGILAYTFGSGPNKVVFVGGMHGTERSSVRTLNAWIDELEGQFNRIPSDKTIVIIPNINPDGYAVSSRTNASNVDLNRNFPSNDWTKDVYQPGNVLLENGGGVTPLSEPESAALASYIQSASPSLVLTYHAVARTVIYNESGNSASLGNLYGSLSGFSSYSSSAEDDVFAYPTTGEFETRLHDKLGIPTLLIENATTSGNEINFPRPHGRGIGCFKLRLPGGLHPTALRPGYYALTINTQKPAMWAVIGG